MTTPKNTKDLITYTQSNSSMGSGSPHHSYPNTTPYHTPYNPYTNPYHTPPTSIPSTWPNIPSQHGHSKAVTNDNFILTHCHPMLRGISRYISNASFSIDNSHHDMDYFLHTNSRAPSITLQYTIKMFNHELDVSLFNALLSDFDVMKTDIIVFTLDNNAHKYIVISDYVCQTVSSHASYEETSIFSFDLEFKSIEYDIIDLTNEN